MCEWVSADANICQLFISVWVILASQNLIKIICERWTITKFLVSRIYRRLTRSIPNNHLGSVSKCFLSRWMVSTRLYTSINQSLPARINKFNNLNIRKVLSLALKKVKRNDIISRFNKQYWLRFSMHIKFISFLKHNTELANICNSCRHSVGSEICLTSLYTLCLPLRLLLTFIVSPGRPI